MFGEEKVSTGTFSAGQEYVFGVDRDLADADELAITIEPEGGAEDGPSGVIVLAGAVEDGEADLSFPVALDQAEGSYLLNTPTAPDAAMESGLWFLEPDPEGDGHVASLDLPDLTNVQGWTYEGWAVIDGTPVTTGRFDDPSMADASAPYSGEESAPPFPGEDFVQNAPEDLEFPTDLADGDSSVVVSVEPDVDGDDPTGDGPFAFKPLAGEIPADAEGGGSHGLDPNPTTLPSGTATVGEVSTVTVDGQVVRDVDGDGHYMDVTGDGSVGQGDVAEFFSKQHRDAWKRPELFDFSGNGAVTHGDVVELADFVALQ